MTDDGDRLGRDLAGAAAGRGREPSPPARTDGTADHDGAGDEPGGDEPAEDPRERPAGPGGGDGRGRSEGAGSAAGAGGRGRRRVRRRRSRSFWHELPTLAALSLFFALLIKIFLVQAFSIPSGSMENTLRVGDRVLVNKIVYDFGPIERGDIVVFNGLDSWDPDFAYTEPANPVQRFFHWVGQVFGLLPGGRDYIKRVVGLPGDEVKCCDRQDRITVNGQPLEESGYLFPGDEPAREPFEVTVPPGRLWVMGDHRSRSSDSRAHITDAGGGSIPEGRVIGRAFVVVWPHWRSLPKPPTFEQQGLAGARKAFPVRARPVLAWAAWCRPSGYSPSRSCRSC